MLDHYAYIHHQLGSVGTPASGTLFVINESSPLPAEACSKRFHNKMARLFYLCERNMIDILTEVAFLTTRVTEATKEDDDRLLHE